MKNLKSDVLKEKGNRQTTYKELKNTLKHLLKNHARTSTKTVYNKNGDVHVKLAWSTRNFKVFWVSDQFQKHNLDF